jgi:hypothetical protein
VQCAMDTPEGKPALSMLSRMSIPVSQGKSIRAHRSLALFLAMDILQWIKRCDNKARIGRHGSQSKLLIRFTPLKQNACV